MSVLLLGGCGYIGLSTAIRILESTDFNVVLFDNFSNSDPSAAESLCELYGGRCEIWRGDALILEDLEAVFNNRKFEYAVHFAGNKSVSESLVSPELYTGDNVAMTKNILSVLRGSSIKAFVFSSSASVYSELAESPLSEDAAVCPKTPYGLSKLLCENLIEGFALQAEGCRFVSLRYFNPVGAAEAKGLYFGDCGIRSKEKPLFPTITEAALFRKDATFSIFGDDYPTRDGTCIRDFIHVEDLAEAHLKALTLGDPYRGHDIINVGTGKGTTVLEVASRFRSVLEGAEASLRIVVAGRREGDLPAGYADTSKAAIVLDWSARRSLDASVSSEVSFRLGKAKSC